MLLTTILLAALADPLAANQQAIRILERSQAAHGSTDPKVSMTIRADLVSEGQSLVAMPPFESYPMRMDVTLDPASRTWRVASSSTIAGDFTFVETSAVKEGKGISYTPETRTWREVAGEPSVLNRYIPQRLLRQVLQDRSGLRAVDDHTVTSGSRTLFFDPKTSLLHRVVQVAPSSFGDSVREQLFEDYKRVGNVLLPSRLRFRTTTAVVGPVENVYRYENVRNDATFAPSDFVAPEGYAKTDTSYRAQFAAKPLAKDVWLLENVTKTADQWSYNVLVVAFDEFVLLAEAPVSSATSERILEKVRELAPGKPVRYLVQSHHHNDHIGGIRAYIAEGTTIVTGATAKPLVEKLAVAPFFLDPDRLHREPRAPKIETVSEPRTIRDANHEVVIYNIGPNPHANDMLIMHLPKEKLLWQADMINDGEYPENAATRDFKEKTSKLEVEKIVGLHGRVR
jgi:hypothetical protein